MMQTQSGWREALAFFTTVWGEDFAGVRLGYSALPRTLGAKALACREHILLRPGVSLDCIETAQLLAHELVHIRQQRRMRTPTGQFQLLTDPRLEDEALLLGERYGRALWSDDQFRRTLERSAITFPATLPGTALPHLPFPADPGSGGFVQCLVEVDGDKWKTGIEPLGSWHFSPDEAKLFKHMLNTQDRTFYFPTRDALFKFCKEKLGIFQKTDLLVNPATKPYFEKVTVAQYEDFQKRDTSWCARIAVTTDKGTRHYVHAYSSIKRHLISSFMQSQFSPRDRKEKNVIVADEALFENKLKDYARFHAAKIKANQMLYAYDPMAAAASYSDPVLQFGTDITYVPSTGWAYENPIHCFPESGSETRNPSQDQYNALVIFLLWYFRTDEHLQEGKKYHKIRHLDSVAADQKLKEVERDIGKARQNLKALKDDYTVDFPVDDSLAKQTGANLELTYSKAKPKPKKHYRVLIAESLRNLHGSLALEGHVPALLTEPIKGKDKAQGVKPASTKADAPEVFFKTHKVEVKKVAGHLTPDLIAWALAGRLTMDAGDLLTVITSSNQAKAHVKEQINAANKRMTDEMRDIEKAIQRLSWLVTVARSVAKLPGDTSLY